MAAPRDPRITLEQMLEAIQDIEQVTAGRNFEVYAADPAASFGRALHGNRFGSIAPPASLKASHPEIPWQKVASIGNVLRHDYDAVNDATIWHAATVDILPLKAALASLLHELEAGERG